MTVFLLVHYGFQNDYIVLAVYSRMDKAYSERDRIREEKRKRGMAEHHVIRYSVVVINMDDDVTL